VKSSPMRSMARAEASSWRGKENFGPGNELKVPRSP
jgi:hypothetical protein